MNGFSLFQNRIVGDASALRRVEEIKEKNVLQKIDQIYSLNDSWSEYEEEEGLSFVSFEIDYKDGRMGQLIIEDYRCLMKNYNNDLEGDSKDQVLIIYEPQE